MPRLQRFVLLLLAACCAAPGAATAGFFGGETVDGPSADIAALGGIDMARDGTATVVYLKRVAGIDHVFAARMADGVWGAPERLDGTLPLASSQPVVGVANGGATLVAFVNDNRLYSVLRRAKDAAWGSPVPIGDAPAATPSVDLSVNGVGWAAWTSNGDVRVARLQRTGTAFEVLPAPVDISAAAEAGTGSGRPRVAASADGTGLVAWGEGGRVYARRLLRDTLSLFPQEAGVADLGGHVGGSADEPDVDISDDSSFAWVVFRQQFDGGATTRVVARRLVGSAFDPPLDVGAGAFGAEAATSPSVDSAGSSDFGAAFVSETATSRTPALAISYLDVLTPPFPVSAGNAVPSLPTVAVGETSQGIAAWFDTDSGVPAVHASSFKERQPADPETSLVDLALGAVDPAAGLDSAADRYGDAVIGFVQGVGAGRRLTVATWDRPPVNLVQTTNFRWRNVKRLAWEPISEPWGPIVWSISVDGRELGTTERNSFPIAGRLRDGLYRWTLTATDRRGQARSAGPRSLRLDTTGPTVRLSVSGSGTTRRLAARTADRYAGVRSVRFDFGDGSPRAFGNVVRHRFPRGSHIVKVTAIDKAGNARTISRTLRIP